MIPRREITLYPGELGDLFSRLLSRPPAEGDTTREFEEEFAGYVGANYAIATCSGRLGLRLLLEALDLAPGDEIILPAYTLIDLVLMIRDMGLSPVLAEVDRDSFTLDPRLLASRITGRTKVIIPTHLFGIPADLDPILEVAGKHGLFVIEDSAHAIGAEYKGKRTGSLGNAAIFSLDVIKGINTFGGGVVVTSDKGLHDRIREKVKSHRYDLGKLYIRIAWTGFEHLLLKSPLFGLVVFLFSMNLTRRLMSGLYLSLHRRIRLEYTRFADLQAFLGLRQLKLLDRRNEELLEKIKTYQALLGGTVKFQSAPYEHVQAPYFFVIELPFDSMTVRKKLIRKGVDVGIGAEITDDCSKGAPAEEFPVTREISGRLLQLPLYPGLRQRDIEVIARRVLELLD